MKRIYKWIIILALIIFFFFILLFLIPNNQTRRTESSMVVSALNRMRGQAEVIWTDNKGYSDLNCECSESTDETCEEIKEQSGEYPIIYASQDSYCVYAELPSSENLWFCINSEGRANKTIIDPGSSGYCDGNTFICPSPGD